MNPSHRPLDVLLVLTPPWAQPDIPPTAIGALAEHLAARGFAVDAADLNAELFRAACALGEARPAGPLAALLGPLPARDLWEYERVGLWYHELYGALRVAFPRVFEAFFARLDAQRPRIVGFSIYVENIFFAAALVREIRQAHPETRIVFGGPLGFIRLADHLLPPGTVDVFAMGEGEELLLRIIAADADPARLEQDPAVRRLADWPYRPFAAAEAIRDLDVLPFPRYGVLDLSEYSPTAVQIMTSRGCANRCVFCNDRLVFGRRLRERSVESVLAEIRYHVERGVTEIGLNDLNVCAHPARLARLVDAILESGLSFTWGANAALRGLPPELLARMARSGCTKLFFGLETGSARVMRAMRKGATVTEAERTLRDAHAAGIETHVNLIVGFPTETEEDFRETLAFVERNRPWITAAVSLNTLHIVRPSTLWARAAEFGVQFPADDRFPEVRWRSAGVTLDVRLARLSRLIELCNRLGLRYKTTNLAADRDIFERFERGGVAIAAGPLALHLGARVWRLTWSGTPLTADVGFFFDLRGPAFHLGTHHIDWEPAPAGPGRLVAGGRWRDLPVRAHVEAALGPHEVVFDMTFSSDTALEVARLKLGLVVDESYHRWQVGSQAAAFPPDVSGHWAAVGPSDAAGRLPLDPAFRWSTRETVALASDDPAFPRIELAADAGELALFPVIQAGCEPGRAAGFYAATPIRLEPGRTLPFRLTVRVAVDP